MKNFTDIRKLTVQTGGGTVIIHSVPNNHKLVEKFCQQANIQYRGEGLPAITQKVLLQLLKPKREQPSYELRRQIETEQENKCAKCGTECKLELDHIQKISRDPFNRNGRDNLVGLCQECHRDKTYAQSCETEYNPLLSYFNDHTWDHFVMSDKVKQQVYRGQNRSMNVSDVKTLSL